MKKVRHISMLLTAAAILAFPLWVGATGHFLPLSADDLSIARSDLLQLGMYRPSSNLTLATVPYRSQVIIDLAEPATSANGSFSQVPSFKKVVVEHVSVFGYVPTGQKLFVRLKLGGFWYALVMHPQISYANGIDYFVASDTTQLTLEADSILYAWANRNEPQGTGKVYVTIFGYITDV